MSSGEINPLLPESKGMEVMQRGFFVETEHSKPGHGIALSDGWVCASLVGSCQFAGSDPQAET